MAVKFIAAIHNYSGLSTDSKPTSKPAGSTFRETDTGEMFAYDGTSWNVDFPVVDGFATGALIQMDVVHYEVHKGTHYSATYTEDLASGSASNILFETPGSATSNVHFLGVIDTEAAGSLQFSEAPNATVGTVVVGYNSRRMSANTPDMTVTQNGAVTSAGTVLHAGYLGGGAGSKIGGETGLRNEWMLNHSTRYLLQFTCSAASVVAWNLFWYEAPN